jgi:hypothetical protein
MKTATRRCGIDRVAEDVAEHANPDDLVNQSADAGEEEEKVEQELRIKTRRLQVAGVRQKVSPRASAVALDKSPALQPGLPRCGRCACGTVTAISTCRAEPASGGGWSSKAPLGVLRAEVAAALPAASSTRLPADCRWRSRRHSSRSTTPRPIAGASAHRCRCR